MKTLIQSLVVCLLFATVSCKKNTTDTTDSSDGSSSADLVQSATSAIGEGFQSSVSLMNEQGSEEMTAEEYEVQNLDGSDNGQVGIFADCNTISFSSCSSGVKTRTMGGCTRTNSSGASITVNGVVSHTFNDNTNCTAGVAAMTSGTMTRTFSGHYITDSSGGKVLTYTGTDTIDSTTISATDLKDYSDTTRSGGVVVTKTSVGAGTISINGVHRKRIRPSGANGFWHTVYTSSPMSFSYSGGNYTISSGTVNIAYNRIQQLYSTTFTNVVYNGTCCYPVSGSISQSISGGTAVTTTFTSTCGSVTIDGSPVTLPSCGGTSSN